MADETVRARAELEEDVRAQSWPMLTSPSLHRFFYMSPYRIPDSGTAITQSIRRANVCAGA